MTFGHTLGLQGAFCQNGKKMTIFLKLRKSPQNIILSRQKQFFLIPDIILRIWVNFHKKIFHLSFMLIIDSMMSVKFWFMKSFFKYLFITAMESCLFNFRTLMVGEYIM